MSAEAVSRYLAEFIDAGVRIKRVLIIDITLSEPIKSVWLAEHTAGYREIKRDVVQNNCGTIDA